MSPTQLIPPTSHGQVFAGDGRLRRRFSHTGHGPFRPLNVSNLKWGGPCRDHYVLTRETLSGRRPADGADTPGGVFRSGENLPGEGDTADIFRISFSPAPPCENKTTVSPSPSSDAGDVFGSLRHICREESIHNRMIQIGMKRLIIFWRQGAGGRHDYQLMSGISFVIRRVYM